MTLRYEREKSDFFPFHQRPLAPAAQAIRDQIDALLCYEHHNDLYGNIITMLQEISFDFKLAHHNNDLLCMIDEILLSYDETVPSIKETNFNIEIYLIQFLMNSLYYLIDFVGTFGYIPGFIFSVMGIFLNDMGTRILDVCLPHIVLWPLIPIAYCIQQLGLLLKSHFGLKSAVEDLEYEIIVARDNWIRDLTMVDKEEPESGSSYLL
jgi:hypothetical protein